MEVTKHEPGMFSWADLGTPDVEGSRGFYTAILGLESTEMPMGDTGMSYTMLSKGGRSSCAMYPMPDDMKEMTGGPPRVAAALYGGERGQDGGAYQGVGRDSERRPVRHIHGGADGGGARPDRRDIFRMGAEGLHRGGGIW